MTEFCDEHAWVSIGVTDLDDAVARVWTCENCPAWSRQRLDPGAEVDWADTWLAEREP